MGLRSHGEELVHHSDRGVRYASTRFSDRLAEAGVEPSVGSVGGSYDNVLASTINGLYKPRSYTGAAVAQLRSRDLAIPEWTDCFNQGRLPEPAAT